MARNADFGRPTPYAFFDRKIAIFRIFRHFEVFLLLKMKRSWTSKCSSISSAFRSRPENMKNLWKTHFSDFLKKFFSYPIKMARNADFGRPTPWCFPEFVAPLQCSFLRLKFASIDGKMNAICPIVARRTKCRFFDPTLWEEKKIKHAWAAKQLICTFTEWFWSLSTHSLCEPGRSQNGGVFSRTLIVDRNKSYLKESLRQNFWKQNYL